MQNQKRTIRRRKLRTSSGWIGTDESGKGDYFGPLVIAGVFLDQKSLRRIKYLGIKDSKRISDNAIRRLDYEIRSHCLYSVVVIGPEKYNILYEKMKNLNRILAWGHARVIENILLQVDCSKVVSDQFGDERYIKNALMEKGKKVVLKQMVRAEKDLAVASASVVARAEFLRRLEQLSREVGFVLPKGASGLTDEGAKRLVQEKGKESLVRFVKLHFKNTGKVLCPAPTGDTKT
jgi:ribonuclease HIII